MEKAKPKVGDLVYRYEHVQTYEDLACVEHVIQLNTYRVMAVGSKAYSCGISHEYVMHDDESPRMHLTVEAAQEAFKERMKSAASKHHLLAERATHAYNTMALIPLDPDLGKTYIIKKGCVTAEGIVADTEVEETAAITPGTGED